MADKLHKLEAVDVQVRRVGDGIFEIARHRHATNGQPYWEPFTADDLPKKLEAEGDKE